MTSLTPNGPSADGQSPAGAPEARQGGRNTRSRKILWFVLGGIVLVAVAAAWALPKLHFYQLVRQLDASDAKVRLKACRELGSLRLSDGVEHLSRLVIEDPDRGVVDFAAYGLTKAKDPRGLDPIRQAVRNGPDDIVATKLYRYLAKLGGDAERDFLKTQLQDNTPWRTIGAAAAILDANDIAGGAVLLHYMEHGSDPQKLFAAQAFLEFALPMMDMIGQRPPNIDPEPEKTLSSEQVAELKTWWSQRATPRLLNDYVAWHRRPNRKWRDIQRLIHARDRAAKFLGIQQETD